MMPHCSGPPPAPAFCGISCDVPGSTAPYASSVLLSATHTAMGKSPPAPFLRTTEAGMGKEGAGRQGAPGQPSAPGVRAADMASHWPLSSGFPRAHVFIIKQPSSCSICFSTEVPSGRHKGHRGPATANFTFGENPEVLWPGHVPFPPGNSTTNHLSPFYKDGN